jgi:hypothetical protein
MQGGTGSRSEYEDMCWRDATYFLKERSWTWDITEGEVSGEDFAVHPAGDARVNQESLDLAGENQGVPIRPVVQRLFP